MLRGGATETPLMRQTVPVGGGLGWLRAGAAVAGSGLQRLGRSKPPEETAPVTGLYSGALYGLEEKNAQAEARAFKSGDCQEWNSSSLPF